MRHASLDRPARAGTPLSLVPLAPQAGDAQASNAQAWDAQAWDAQDDRKPTGSIARRCDDLIAALLLLAYLQLGDRAAAEAAVIGAVARAAGVPTSAAVIPDSVWHVLATHLRTESERRASAYPGRSGS